MGSNSEMQESRQEMLHVRLELAVFPQSCLISGKICLIWEPHSCSSSIVFQIPSECCFPNTSPKESSTSLRSHKLPGRIFSIKWKSINGWYEKMKIAVRKIGCNFTPLTNCFFFSHFVYDEGNPTRAATTRIVFHHRSIFASPESLVESCFNSHPTKA